MGIAKPMDKTIVIIVLVIIEFSRACALRTTGLRHAAQTVPSIWSLHLRGGLHMPSQKEPEVGIASFWKIHPNLRHTLFWHTDEERRCFIN
jgi:hypothetical protein